jgi:hypothetical protein
MNQRKQLKTINQQRMRFRASFERYGEKPAYRGFPIPTLLLKDVCRIDTGEQVTDHLWFTVGAWTPPNLIQGERIEFDARVKIYEKGYQGRLAEERGEAWYSLDYKLSHPTKCYRVAT